MKGCLQNCKQELQQKVVILVIKEQNTGFQFISLSIFEGNGMGRVYC